MTMLSSEWPTWAIFVATYLLMALGKVPGLRMDRAAIAFVGATLILVTGVVSVQEAMGPGAIDCKTLLLLFGMMVVAGFLQLAGVFARITDRALERIKTPHALLAATILIVGILSAVLVNDIICIALTPIVVHLARKLRFDPLPHVIAIATASNIGSTATITGNPQNMIIGVQSGIPYLRFTAHLLPIALIGLAVNYCVIIFVCRKNLAVEAEAGANATAKKRTCGPVRSRLQTKGIIVTLLALVLFCLGFEMALVAIGAAALLFIGRIKSEKLMRQVDWPLLVMFAGLFIVVQGFQLHIVKHWNIEHWTWMRDHPITLLSLASALLSNIVSNVPAVLLFKPVMQAIPHAAQQTAWLALAASSTLAGNLTVLGSVANLIVVERARREGVTISFRDYFKVGLPVTVLTLAIAMAWLAFANY